ncbi:uncharacterized protein BCR38DRAFT_490899 [Pseudomassariella vexata]|uniref:Uncharacterized protein n=1 Tax=Pseudomassariella vexata TaxID=1141098 RepID=A0A1Y2D9F8_9PEZI|nr:uncharacterized protein BCR38DRAFT_490899 [Pseudomassariella vexata]ORY55893.1 hypothetical protein BCR38DRAFT_490899 [Pseudomassariella vexata]
MTKLLHGFCVSICFTSEQEAESEIGKGLASYPLINVKPQPHALLPPIPPIAFPPFKAYDRKPLANIKVFEITRISTGPQIRKILASLSVNRLHLPDINVMQLTLRAGKWTCAIDL